MLIFGIPLFCISQSLNQLSSAKMASCVPSLYTYSEVTMCWFVFEIHLLYLSHRFCRPPIFVLFLTRRGLRSVVPCLCFDEFRSQISWGIRCFYRGPYEIPSRKCEKIWRLILRNGENPTSALNKSYKTYHTVMINLFRPELCDYSLWLRFAKV